MNCEAIRELLDAYADDETGAPDAWRVERHLRDCELCRGELDAVLALRRDLRAADLYQRAPAALRERIAAQWPAPAETGAAADAASASAAVRRRRFGRLLDLIAGRRGGGAPRGFALPGFGIGFGPQAGGGWAAVALVACVGCAALWTQRPTPADALARDVVAGHVRALLSGHEIDVVSTDRHTVKPWFDGRLDYAPPVADLAAQGFPLVGGRLDFVGGRRVAVLAYRFRQHPIDVYVFPRAAADRAPRLDATPQGYVLARWQRGGMAYWAITDASADVLAQFARALDGPPHEGPLQ